jgi:hypothetical protein
MDGPRPAGGPGTNPTLGANKGYASKTRYFSIEKIPCLDNKISCVCVRVESGEVERRWSAGRRCRACMLHATLSLHSPLSLSRAMYSQRKERERVHRGDVLIAEIL